MAKLAFFVERMDSPVGELIIVTDGAQRLRALMWAEAEADMRRGLERHYGKGAVTLTDAPSPSQARQALAAYFAGDLAALETIAVETGGTAFQRDVWAALRRIPVGATTSYGAIAAGIGRPRAVRAVGMANGANPIGIVVPCHRVIGADASLTGYGGGLERKRWLLRHEGAAFRD